MHSSPTIADAVWTMRSRLKDVIDASEQKDFLLRLLFLKRVNDAFEERAERLVAEGEPDEVAWGDKVEHPVFVGAQARWSRLAGATNDCGAAINTAMVVLEDDNAALSGVLAGLDFHHERLGDNRQRHDLWSRVVADFGELSLRNDDLRSPDEAGRAFQILAHRFMVEFPKKERCEYPTPPELAALLVRLVAPAPGERIHDFACGVGDLLLEARDAILRVGGASHDLTLHGQELVHATWTLGVMNHILHESYDSRLLRGDSISNPAFRENGQLETYHVVISHPPFAIEDWAFDATSTDSRFSRCRPARGKQGIASACVQHGLSAMKESSRFVCVWPTGLLFRKGERALRRSLCTAGILKALIALPSKIYAESGGASVVAYIVRGDVPESGVLMVNASNRSAGGVEDGAVRLTQTAA